MPANNTAINEFSDKKWLTISEASRLVDVSTKTLKRWEAKGLVTSQRTVGGQRRFHKQTLEELIAKKNLVKAFSRNYSNHEIAGNGDYQTDSRNLGRSIPGTLSHQSLEIDSPNFSSPPLYQKGGRVGFEGAIRGLFQRETASSYISTLPGIRQAKRRNTRFRYSNILNDMILAALLFILVLFGMLYFFPEFKQRLVSTIDSKLSKILDKGKVAQTVPVTIPLPQDKVKIPLLASTFFLPSDLNLLTNSSFEGGNNGAEPKAWNYISESGNNNTKVSPDSIRSGTLALRLYDGRAGPTSPLSFGIAQPSTTTVNGRNYVFTVYLRTTSDGVVGNPNLRLGFLGGGSDDVYKDFSLTSQNIADWTAFSFTYKDAKLGKYPFVQILNDEGGTIFLDDLSLYELNNGVASSLQLEDGITTNYQLQNTNLIYQNITKIGDGSVVSDASGNIYPATNADGSAIFPGSLGLKDHRFERLYIRNADISGDLGVAGSTSVNNLSINGNVMATGSFNIGFTPGSVVFEGSTGFAQDNNNFFWDDTNDRLSIGSKTPIYTLDVAGIIRSTTGAYLATNAGNVGIGTTNPLGKFNIVGTGTNTGFSLLTQDSSGTHRFSILDNGNVGIGVTLPTDKLDIAGGVKIGGGYVGIANSAPANGLLVQGNVGIGSTTAGSTLEVAGGVKVGAGLIGIGITTPNNGLLVQGNTGIGTTAPRSLVHVVNGDLHLGTGTFNNASSAEDLYVTGNIEVDGNAYLSAVTTANNNPGTDNTFDLGTAALRWQTLYLGPNGLNIYDTTGTSGAGSNYTQGSLSASNGTLTLSTTTVGTSTGGIVNIISTYPSGKGASSAFNITNSNNLGATDEFLQFGDSADTFLTILGNGNVGVGTSVPSSKLSISGGVGIGTTAPGSDYTKLAVAPDGGLIVQGNVGLGTTTPGAALDVAGGVKIGAGNIGTAITAPTNGLIVQGNVGVGSTAPNAALEVSGAVKIGAGIIGGTFTAPANGLLVQGNVGIGTTAPTAKLDVAGNLVLSAASPTISAGASGATLAIDANAGGAVNIAGTSTGDVNFAGGSGSTGCTITNSTGALACSGNITGGATGTIGYWARVGTTLYPATATDNVGTLGNIGVGSTNPGTARLAVLSGNLGIGATAPSNFLSVSGGVGIGTTAPGSDYTKTAVAPDGGLIVEGNIGIGTTTPVALLTLSTTANQPLFRVDDNGVGDTSPFIIDTTGNVGIGTSNPGSTLLAILGGNVGIGVTSPTSLLAVGGSTGLALGTSATSLYIVTATSPSGGAIIQGNVGIGTTTPGAALDVAGGVKIGVGLIGSMTAPVNGLLVQGNVGIGTTSVPSLFSVGSSSTTTTYGSIGAILALQNTDPTNNNGVKLSFQGFDTNGAAIGAGRIGSQITSHTPSALTADMVFETNNAGTIGENMRILAGGNVGIGTTKPGNLLDIAGAVKIGVGLIGTMTAPANGLLVQGNVGIGQTSPVTTLAVAGNMKIGSGYIGTTFTAPTDGLLIQGHVGIGTTNVGNPSFFLAVEGNIGIGSTSVTVHSIEPNISLNGSARTLQFKMNSSQNTEGWQFFNANGSKNVMFLQEAGNVGIGVGNTNPGNTLHVVGGIRVATLAAASATTVCRDANNDLSTCSSSRQFKDNIKYLSDSDYGKFLKDIVDANLATFHMIPDGPNSPTHLGIIAEEAPDFLKFVDENGNNNIDFYSYNGGYAWAGIKALAKQNVAQESEIASISAQMSLNNSGDLAATYNKNELDQKFSNINTSLGFNTDTIAGLVSSGSEASLSAELLDQKSKIKDQRSQIVDLSDSVASISAKLKDLESQLTLVESIASLSGSLANTSLSSSDSAVLAGDLTVLGKTNLGKTFITDKLSVGLLSIDPFDASINTLAIPLKLQSHGLSGIDILNGKIVIDTQGNIKVSETLTAKKFNVDTSDILGASLGKTTIPAGTTSLTIQTTAVSTQSAIFVTPIESPIPVATEATKSGQFVIRIPQALPQDLRVNWWVVN